MPIKLGDDFVTGDPEERGETQAWTKRPERSILDVTEGRSARMADFLAKTPGAFQAVRKFVAALEHYAYRNNLKPTDIRVEDAQTHTGPDGARFVAFFRRRTRLIAAKPARRRRRD